MPRLPSLPLPRTLLLMLLGLASSFPALARNTVTFAPIPEEVRSNHYTVTIDGQKTPVVHAASNYSLLNFDTAGPVTVSVTAEDPHFWDRGVEIQPMRLGIRPVRHGATITFPLAGPEKLTVSRPGDHFGEADMLFLFANPPEVHPPTPNTPGVRYYGPGAHHESIDAHSGDRIYLAPGAVIFGSLNIWQVQDVHVFGRGMIVYDGPQNPADDDGWMHKPNWHAIVMDNARNIEINGITTVVRSRTWQIQMKDSRGIGFYDFKAVAGVKGDANQDGMDWLGGGETTVRNSFFRASDDVFALQGNWEGYSDEAMRRPGHDVTNISIENTEVSTSISNIVRVGWPEKTFSSAHFHMRGIDVLHAGYGDCKVPFAFFELWADPGGVGRHTDYSFENIRLDDWYSLFQIRYPNPAVRDVSFRGVYAMDGTGMVASALKGYILQVALVDAAATEGRFTEVLNGAYGPETEPNPLDVSFTYSAGLLKPGQRIEFGAAAPDGPGRKFAWLFGDGTRASGRHVTHAFPDAQGTLLDGSGRFRVLLHIINANGTETWHNEPVVLSTNPLEPTARGDSGHATIGYSRRGDLIVSSVPSPQDHIFSVSADGGYDFTILTRAPARVSLDGQPARTSPKPRPVVCDSPEAAIQPLRISAGLLKGSHRLHIEAEPSAPEPVLLWEGPGLQRQILTPETK